MGYYASGYGECTLKDGVDLILLNYDLNMNGAHTIDVNRLTASKMIDVKENRISISTEDQKYYEEEVYCDLNILTKYITEGYIDFVGEDDAHWRIALKDGEWSEQNGEVVYDMSKYSDQELIDELDRRGYNITQLFNLAQSM